MSSIVACQINEQNGPENRLGHDLPVKRERPEAATSNEQFSKDITQQLRMKLDQVIKRAAEQHKQQ